MTHSIFTCIKAFFYFIAVVIKKYFLDLRLKLVYSTGMAKTKRKRAIQGQEDLQAEVNVAVGAIKRDLVKSLGLSTVLLGVVIGLWVLKG